ncbi:MAG TPA: SDR family oxidoreductase [Candidatus Marinimicrobia bacterium]|nr:SDR family oxidoreductase [Candidatus Neomarinimicrobiota bacterium]MDP7217178.1 SDR family oxidoreductase [Candidatus Neomarinimicrobiota bacterium]MDP7437383.1 SDR family oxidoreductase [Candidatus Neomarinimicrobiota bacterium]HJL74556.1 SDR family oxidoreductase [Candidatus Neomarinimicrobiota bacterium]HJM69358.1 SDR family oxidoreductase [Candidatus Neomarinimicrobiota bacterium]
MSHQGKVCIITGATDGIGKEVALNLAKMGFTLGLVGRNAKKISATESEIKATADNENITFFNADLSSMDQVRQLALEIQAKYNRIDVLLNNAGAYFTDYGKTDEGFENTFALNHLSYFLFTDLLLDTIKVSPQSRIVNVASNAHLNTNLDFENLQGFNGYKGWPAYCKSKLCNVMFTYELARRLEGSGTTANCLHPGFVHTNFGNNNKTSVRMSLTAAKALGAINVKKGAQTSIYLASSAEVDGVSGQYFSKCRPKTSSPQSQVLVDQQRLWSITEQLLN